MKEIDYDRFRELMVASFLSRRSGNAIVDAAAARIDVVCADFSQGLIQADTLEAYMRLALQNSDPRTPVGSVAQLDTFQPSVSRPVSAAKESSAVFELAAVA
ncbi:MAG TPA: hypothetical protein VKX49_05635 [Bryobacteraceae bacterium]|nr:hypothetical protein [Bryobacteraceae bacterium]